MSGSNQSGKEIVAMRRMKAKHPLITSSVVWSVLLWGSSWVAQGSVAQSQSTAQGTDNQTSAAKSGPNGGADEKLGRPNTGARQREWLAEEPSQSGSPSPQMGPGQSPRQTG